MSEHVPPEVLASMVEENMDDEGLLWRIVQNPQVGKEALEALTENDDESIVRQARRRLSDLAKRTDREATP